LGGLIAFNLRAPGWACSNTLLLPEAARFGPRRWGGAGILSGKRSAELDARRAREEARRAPSDCHASVLGARHRQSDRARL